MLLLYVNTFVNIINCLFLINNNMAHSQQRLTHLTINGLRKIINLNISFENKNVTGIFGVNGVGKTTLIHTLLCLYKAPAGKKNFNFGAFFKRCRDHEFDHTQIIAKVHFRNQRDVKDVEYEYKKSPGSDRWTPKTSSRPEREVFYLGISSCIPSIEEEIKVTQKYRYIDGAIVSDNVRIVASRILGIQYSSIIHSTRGKKDHYHATINNGDEYYSISMGAGEQRVLRILEFLENIPNYALVVIDEIDLTLHTAALNKLLDHLVFVANNKNIQIIFTSHREEILTRNDINIRHLIQTSNGTICLNNANPDCFDCLTGRILRPLEVYVEDDLAATIVATCAEEIGIKKRVSIHHYGSCENAFVLGSALHIMGIPINNKLFVLDGDLYRTDQEKLEQIKKHYSGNEPWKDEARNAVKEMITSFQLPAGVSPEQFINQIIKQPIADSDLELVRAAEAIIAPRDTHLYVDEVIETTGDIRSVGLYRIVKELHKHHEWSNYVININNWLQNKKAELNL